MADEGLRNLASQEFIHVTTTGRKTGKPHTVELWFAVKNGRVYLSHEGSETDWMKNIQHYDHISFEIAGKNFRGRARPSKVVAKRHGMAKSPSMRNTMAKHPERSSKIGSHYRN